VARFWRVRLRLVLSLAILLVGLGFVQTDAQGERIVMALYYPWYGMDTWEDPVLSDVPAIPYNGFDPEAIARHVGWAQDAGIDVLVSAWFGPGNGTDPNLQLVMEAVNPERMSVAILFETDSPEFFSSLASQQAALEYALSVHASHPAYFRHQGKPVIVVWRPRGIFIGNQRANRDDANTVSAWRQLRDQVDPHRESVWIAESENGIYLDVFDGLVTYNIAAAADPAARLAANARTVRDYNARNGTRKLWIATVMPGYDDSRLLDRADRFARAREDGAYYRRTFAGAVATNPDMISIHSFNEWVEGHQIEPSVTYGSLYLDLTRELVAAWKGG
jgi:hypothetical protein